MQSINSRKAPVPIFTILIVSLISVSGFTQTSINQGIQLFEEGNLAEAKTFFTGYLKTNKNNAEANFYLGRIYFDENEFDKASDWIEKAAKYDEGNSKYHMWLGHAYGRRAQEAGKLRQPFLAADSRNNYEKAIELDPTNIEARESAIEFYLQAPGFMGGGRDKAEAQAHAISDLDGVGGFRAWGRIYTYYDEIDQAHENYTTALEIHPEAMEFYYQLYNFYFAQQDFESAVEITKSQLNFNDTTAVIYLNFGNALQRNDQFDEALIAYETAMDLDPDLYNVWYQIGRMAAVSGLYSDKGEEYLIKFISLDDKVNDATLAWAHFRLGTVFENKNALVPANEQYRIALQKDKDHAEAKAALERLN